MTFGLKNVNFDHSHIGTSTIKNIFILGLILLSMARIMSKYVAKNKLWPIWGLFGYLCCLNHLRVKLTHARVITSFQTLSEIGLKIKWFVWQLKMRSENLVKSNYQKQHFGKFQSLIFIRYAKFWAPNIGPPKRER